MDVELLMLGVLVDFLCTSATVGDLGYNCYLKFQNLQMGKNYHMNTWLYNPHSREKR